MIFVVINQINKYKAKIYDHCTYTLIILKKFIYQIQKQFFCFVGYKDDKFVIRRAKTNSTNEKYK